MKKLFIIAGLSSLLTTNTFAQQTINEVLTVNTNGPNTIRVENNVAGQEATIRFRSKPSVGSGWLHSDIGVYATASNVGFLGFKIPHNNSFGVGYKMVINSSGNVGIGTIEPSSKLDVEGGDFYLGEKVSVNGERRQVRIYGYDNNSKFYGAFHSNYDDDRRTFDISSSSATNQLKIDASANPNGRIIIMPGSTVGVGIGTLQTGTHKLAVEGTIGARGVKIESTGWSDFVFKPDYELMTLEELENYITNNEHLPEIPSEEEVTINGINLGEMDAKLLQKVEELTLYVIEVNKQMNSQNERIKLIEKENLELRTKISIRKNQ